MLGGCGWLVATCVVLLAIGALVPVAPPGSVSSGGELVESRPYEQTFFAQSEWFIVDVVQLYGDFMESRPFYDFDYMGVTWSYWKRFGTLTQEIVHSAGVSSMLASSYFYMQLFMGTLLTVNFAAIGTISIPIRLAIGGQEPDLILVRKTGPHNATELEIEQWPRYKLFLRTLLNSTTPSPSSKPSHPVAGESVGLVRIAGHETVAVKFCTGKMDALPPEGIVRVVDDYALVGRRYLIAIARVADLQNWTTPSSWTLAHVFDF